MVTPGHEKRSVPFVPGAVRPTMRTAGAPVEPPAPHAGSSTTRRATSSRSAPTRRLRRLCFDHLPRANRQRFAHHLPAEHRRLPPVPPVPAAVLGVPPEGAPALACELAPPATPSAPEPPAAVPGPPAGPLQRARRRSGRLSRCKQPETRGPRREVQTSGRSSMRGGFLYRRSWPGNQCPLTGLAAQRLFRARALPELERRHVDQLGLRAGG